MCQSKRRGVGMVWLKEWGWRWPSAVVLAVLALVVCGAGSAALLSVKHEVKQVSFASDCSGVTVDWDLFKEPSDTVSLVIYMDGAKVYDSPFTFSGGAGSKTVPLNLKGEHVIEILSDWTSPSDGYGFYDSKIVKLSCATPVTTTVVTTTTAPTVTTTTPGQVQVQTQTVTSPAVTTPAPPAVTTTLTTTTIKSVPGKPVVKVRPVVKWRTRIVVKWRTKVVHSKPVVRIKPVVRTVTHWRTHTRVKTIIRTRIVIRRVPVQVFSKVPPKTAG